MSAESCHKSAKSDPDPIKGMFKLTLHPKDPVEHDLNSALMSLEPHLKICRNEYVKSLPQSFQMDVEFNINNNGNVTAAGIISGPVKPAEFLACVENNLRKIKIRKRKIGHGLPALFSETIYFSAGD